MFDLSEKILIQFRILILIPIMAALIISLKEPEGLRVSDSVMPGAAQITIDESGTESDLTVEITEFKSTDLSQVSINESSLAELLACPGINTSTAEAIILERKHKPFYDWRDLRDRVKGFGPAKIENLKKLGIKINPGE